VHTFNLQTNVCFQYTGLGAGGQTGASAAPRAASASADETEIATHLGRRKTGTTATATTSIMKSAVTPTVMVCVLLCSYFHIDVSFTRCVINYIDTDLYQGYNVLV